MKATQAQIIIGYMLVSLFMGSKLFSQVDTLDAHRWFLLADSLSLQAAYDSSNHYFQQAAEVYQNGSYWDRYIISLNQIGMNLTNLARFEEAEEVLERAEKASQSHLSSPHPAIAHTQMCIGYLNHYTGNFEQAIQGYEAAMEMRRELYGPDHPELASTATNLGSVWGSLGEEAKALELHHESLRILGLYPEDSSLDRTTTYNNLAISLGTMGDLDQSLEYLLLGYELDKQKFGPDHPYIAIACNNIGYIYGRKGDFERALSFHQQSLSINTKTYGPNHPSLARNHSQIASCYLQEGQFEEALEEYDIALKIRRISEPTHHERFALIYNNMGLTYLYQKKYEEAEAHFREAIRLNDLVHNQQHRSRGLYLSNLGLSYHQRKDYERALTYNLEAEAIYQEAYQAPHDELVRLYHHIADVHRRTDQFEQAKQYFRKALYSATHLPADQQTAEVPAVDDLQLSLEVLDAAAGRAHIFLQQSWQEDQPIPRLTEALEAAQYATIIADTLRPSFRYRISQSLLTAELKSLFQTGIRSSLALYRHTGEPSYLESALQFSEKSKYLLLLDARNHSEAKRFAGISDSLLQREKQLEMEIAYYEKKLYQAQSAESTSTSLTDWQESLFSLKEERIAFLTELEQSYPIYFQLKYPPTKLNLNQLQQETLAPNQSLLEYFVGEDSLYIFCINRDKISYAARHIREDRLGELVDSLRQSIYGYHIFPFPDEDLYQQSSREYTHFAHELYKLLIQPIENDLQERIVLIPDGVLGYIPFAALLQETPLQPTEFRDHSYLIQDHSISYAFSAQILTSFDLETGTSPTNKGVLAMAPGFAMQEYESSSVESYRNEYLGPLRYNQEEIASIREILPGKSLFDKEATLSNFLSLAPSYSILHIATHGKANEEEADFSFLAFASPKQSSDPEFLYIRDLYNLQLGADLVVLSACETGTGELQRGEGIVSLAQGFAYAGVPSILTTLWSINDQQTALWMERFYAHLLERSPKDQAVRHAHQDYLASQDDFHAHPFFWAPYVPIGDMQPVEISERNQMRWLLGMLIVGILAGGVWVRRKKGKSED